MEDVVGCFSDISVVVESYFKVVGHAGSYVVKDDGEAYFIVVRGIDYAGSGTDVGEVGDTCDLTRECIVVGVYIETILTPSGEEHSAESGTFTTLESVVEEFGGREIAA